MLIAEDVGQLSAINNADWLSEKDEYTIGDSLGT